MECKCMNIPISYTSLQRGDREPSSSREPFQRFSEKPLKRLRAITEPQSTSLKQGVNEIGDEIAKSNRPGNTRFQNALARTPQAVPPIWLMRQAGRYHSHYQNLRRRYSFMELCKTPELAAEVALGPVLDFDFDAPILFSDLLFPLEALGMGLSYTDRGPELGWRVDDKSIA